MLINVFMGPACLPTGSPAPPGVTVPNQPVAHGPLIISTVLLFVAACAYFYNKRRCVSRRTTPIALKVPPSRACCGTLSAYSPCSACGHVPCPMPPHQGGYMTESEKEYKALSLQKRPLEFGGTTQSTRLVIYKSINLTKT